MLAQTALHIPIELLQRTNAAQLPNGDLHVTAHALA